MADIFSARVAKPRGVFKQPRRRSKAVYKKPHKGGGGIGGFMGNLGRDVRDTVVGLPRGVVETVRNPIKTGKAIGKQYAQYYGPLARGDFREFAGNVQEHPLQLGLDLLPGVNVGFGVGGRIAKVGTGTTLKTAKGAKVARTYRRGSASRAKSALYDKAAKNINRGPLKETSRAARLAARQQGAARAQFGGRHRAVKKVAAGVSDKDLDNYVARTLNDTKKMLTTNAKRAPLHPNFLEHGESWVAASNFRPGQRAWLTEDATKLKDLVTTRNPNEAMRTRSGNGREGFVIRDDVVRDYGKTLQSNKQLERVFFEKPTAAWKWMVLAARPAFLVNNVVGNTFMNLVNQNPARAVVGYTHALRSRKGDQAVVKLANDRGNQALIRKGIWDKYWGEQIGTSMSQELLPGSAKGGKVAQHIKGGFFGPTQHIAENFTRKSALAAELTRHRAKIKQIQKRDKTDYWTAADRFLAKNPRVVKQIGQHVTDALGQYYHLTRAERNVRKVVPFYTWDRALARSLSRTVMDRPGRVVAGAAISRQGVALTEEELGGQVPSFLRGAVRLPGPLPGAGMEKGRIPILTTQGLNPYATGPELFDSAASMLGGDPAEAGATMGSQFNPFIQEAIQQLSQKRLLTGGPLPDRPGPNLGFLGNVAAGPFLDLPQTKIGMHIAGRGTSSMSKKSRRTGKRYPKFYQGSLAEQLYSYGGVPFRGVSPSGLRFMYAKDKEKGRVI